MEELFRILGCICVAWFIKNLDPLQRFFEWVAEKNGVFNQLFFELLTCLYCLGFWITLLAFTLDFDFPKWVVLPIATAIFLKTTQSFYERVFK